MCSSNFEQKLGRDLRSAAAWNDSQAKTILRPSMDSVAS
jgi:hypothetical protein